MTDSASTVAAFLEESAPEPSGAELVAPEAATSEPQAPPPPSHSGAAAAHFADARDRNGREFDPKIHQVNERGEPVLTLKGELRIIGNQGRKRGIPNRGGSYIPPRQSAATPSVDPRIRSTAEVTVGMISLAFAFGGGEHWNTSDAERENLVNAWSGYYAIRGMIDLPPEVMLVTAYGAWIASNPERAADAISGVRGLLVGVGILAPETPAEEPENEWEK